MRTSVAIHQRHVDDTLQALAVQLLDEDRDAVDITNYTVKFAMYKSDGTAAIAETSSGVTISNASTGTVEFSFSASQVATAGTYYGYFIVEDGAGAQETYPSRRGDLEIIIHAAT